QRAAGLQEAFDLRRESDLVRLAAELLQDLPRAALLAHDVELLLRIVRRVERRIDETGIDDRYRDAAAFEFEPHAFGEIDNRRLARAVAAVAGPAGIAEQRAHDGNVSRLARQHLRQHRR